MPRSTGPAKGRYRTGLVTHRQHLMTSGQSCRRWRRSSSVVPVATFLLAASVAAQAPGDLPRRDGRSVYDLAGLITPEHEQSMEAGHHSVLEKTGVAIAVVTLVDLGGEDLVDVLTRADPAWGLGRGDEDRGIVIALAMREQRILIATGLGVEEFLPDSRSKAILNQVIIPHLRKSDVSAALKHGSAALIAATEARYGIKSKSPVAVADVRRNSNRGVAESLVVILFMVALVLRPLAGRLLARRSSGGPRLGQ